MSDIKRHGYSYPHYKKEICILLKKHLPKDSSALDIGAGEGIYFDYLHDYFIMDAVEIYEPYIEMNKLKEKYINVFNLDIRNYILTKKYDLIILGDIIEHMSVQDAQRVVQMCKNMCKVLMVAIPYNLSQGPLDGNQYEEHIQDDLTPQIFNERYPDFICVFRDLIYGYYIWRG